MKQLLLLLCVLILLVTAMMLLCGCENYQVSDEINGLLKKNDISISIKVQDNPDGFISGKILENSYEYTLKIDVMDTYSLRGEAPVEPGNKYKLSVTLKNSSADPIISYSFWEKPKTSLRYFIFKGENGNPPISKTQAVYNDWTTFEEAFETLDGEDSFMLTLHCGKGTFYIKEINIERMP
jgi:hypothetical protein